MTDLSVLIDGYLANSVNRYLATSAETILKLMDHSDSLDKIAKHLYMRLRAGNKVLICGNGGSASDAQHMATELVGRFEYEREAMPVLALNSDTSTLTALANDYGYANVFARQVEAHGNDGDILIVISTSGQSANILRAVLAAKKAGMTIIALTGSKGLNTSTMLTEGAKIMQFKAPSTVTSKIQECHIVAIHAICKLVEELWINRKVK